MSRCRVIAYKRITIFITLNILFSDGSFDTSGDTGKVVFVRSGGDTTSGLTVNFKIKGTATNGMDYTDTDGNALDSSVTFPAGTTKMKVKLVGKQDGVASGTKTIIIKLTKSSDGSYSVGSSAKAKLTLTDNEEFPLQPGTTRSCLSKAGWKTCRWEQLASYPQSRFPTILASLLRSSLGTVSKRWPEEDAGVCATTALLFVRVPK